MSEVTVLTNKVEGLFRRLLCVGSVDGNNRSNANGNNNLDNNNGRLVGIVKLIQAGALILIWCMCSW